MPYKCTYKSVQTAIQSVQIDVQHKTRLVLFSKRSKMTTKGENMDYNKSYLICYKPQSFKGYHKQKLVETYTEALEFMNRVQKRGTIVYCIYAPNGEKVYDRRWNYENTKNN